MHKTNFNFELHGIGSVDVDVTFVYDDYDSSVGERESVSVQDVVYVATDRFGQDNPISLLDLFENSPLIDKLEDFILKNHEVEL